MKGDVAMQEPGARVVGFEREDQVAVGGQEGDVAAGRVGEGEVDGGGGEGGGGLGEDGEVVTVEMDLGGVISRFILRGIGLDLRGVLRGQSGGSG